MASRDTTESTEAKPKSALDTRAPTRPRRPRSEARPAEGRKRANVPRRAPPTGRARRLPEAHTMAGRGSAERSRAARPRWVMMEISRVARASTAERSGSSSGACCIRILGIQRKPRKAPSRKKPLQRSGIRPKIQEGAARKERKGKQTALRERGVRRPRTGAKDAKLAVKRCYA